MGIPEFVGRIKQLAENRSYVNKRSIGSSESVVMKAIADHISESGLNSRINLKDFAHSIYTNQTYVNKALQGNKDIKYKGPECLEVDSKSKEVKLKAGNPLLHCVGCQLRDRGSHFVEGTVGCPIQSAVKGRLQLISNQANTVLTNNTAESLYSIGIDVDAVNGILRTNGKQPFTQFDNFYYDHELIGNLDISSPQQVVNLPSVLGNPLWVDATHYYLNPNPQSIGIDLLKLL